VLHEDVLPGSLLADTGAFLATLSQVHGNELFASLNASIYNHTPTKEDSDNLRRKGITNCY
jgi:hypothetical protein